MLIYLALLIPIIATIILGVPVNFRYPHSHHLYRKIRLRGESDQYH